MEKGPVIFLIDDDADDRELFQLALEYLSYPTELSCASSAREGLQMLDDGIVKPDFIFFDLNMHGMGGQECLQILKDDPRTASIPTVIYSTSAVDRDISESRRRGASEFITKPARLEKLTSLLDHFLQKQFQKAD